MTVTKKQILITGLVSLFTAGLGFYGAIYATQKGLYLQNAIESRKELSDSLANYYSASARFYYAETDWLDMDDSKFDKNSPYYLAVYNEQNKAYEAFISASTNLSAHVPKALREKVISIENIWDGIDSNDLNRTEVETKWFNNLDEIRQTILDQLTEKESLDPIWK